MSELGPLGNQLPLLPGRAELELELQRILDEKARAEELLAADRVAAVDNVRARAAAEKLAVDHLRLAVAGARLRGATWQQIADAAGMSRQSAWKRWASPTDHDCRPDDDGRCQVCGGDLR